MQILQISENADKCAYSRYRRRRYSRERTVESSSGDEQNSSHHIGTSGRTPPATCTVLPATYGSAIGSPLQHEVPSAAPGPSTPRTKPATSGSLPATPGSLPATPGSQPATPGSLRSLRISAGSLPAAPFPSSDGRKRRSSSDTSGGSDDRSIAEIKRESKEVTRVVLMTQRRVVI